MWLDFSAQKLNTIKYQIQIASVRKIARLFHGEASRRAQFIKSIMHKPSRRTW